MQALQHYVLPTKAQPDRSADLKAVGKREQTGMAHGYFTQYFHRHQVERIAVIASDLDQ